MKSGLRNLLFAGTLALGLAGCEKEEIKPDPKPNPTPNPPQEEKSISLEAKLSDSTTIDYNVALNNIDNASLDVYRNDSLVKDYSKGITSEKKTGVYDNLEKGNYELVASRDTLSDSKSVMVPNYSPKVDLNGLDKQVREDEELSWNLKNKISDLNHEDNPVPIDTIYSTDGKVEVTRNGYEIKIKPVEGKTGNSGLEIKVGSDEGGFKTEKINVDVSELQYRNYSGTLEDNITNSGAEGKINIFKQITSTDKFGQKWLDYEKTFSQENYLGQVETDANGNFDFKVPEDLRVN